MAKRKSKAAAREPTERENLVLRRKELGRSLSRLRERHPRIVQDLQAKGVQVSRQEWQRLERGEGFDSIPLGTWKEIVLETGTLLGVLDPSQSDGPA